MSLDTSPASSPELLLSVLQVYGFNQAPYQRTTRVDAPPKLNDFEKKKQHLVNVLDALAAVCTPLHHVTAISVALSPGGLVFNVAQNEAVNNSVLEHIQGLWQDLMKLNELRYRRTLNPQGDTSPEPDDDGELKRQKKAVKCRVYAFCMSKLRSRLNKRAQDMDKFAEIMYHKSIPDAQMLRDWLLDYNVVVFWVGKAVEETPPTASTCSAIAREMDKTYRLWTKLTKEEVGALSRWELAYIDHLKSEEKQSSPSPEEKQPPTFSFRRFVEKYYTMHVQIETLISLGLSKAMRTVFKLPFQVHKVDPVRRKIEPFDFSEGYVQSIVRPLILERRGPRAEEFDESTAFISPSKFIRGLPARYKPHASRGDETNAQKAISLDYSASVPHAECNLLVYHHSLRGTTLQPYPYIGVSKLSCYACHLFFEAYNSCSRLAPISVRGTHQKLYPAWVRPRTFERDASPDSSLDNCVSHYMKRQICSDIGQSGIERLRGRTASDSTNESAGSGHNSNDMTETEPDVEAVSESVRDNARKIWERSTNTARKDTALG